MTVYVAEEFTPDEADVLRRYFTNLDGPVFALVNLPEVVKGALFARYSRSSEEPAAAVPRRVRRRPRHHRRRHHRRHRRPPAGRGALRPGLLRVRRRLRRPARRRAPGLRAGLEPAHQGARVGPADGLPRAVHPLHRLRHPPRRPLPLLPRPRGARLEPRPPLRRRHGPAVRRLRRAGAAHGRLLPGPVPEGRRPTPTSSTARPSGPRRSTPCAASCPAASLSNVGIYGTGQGYEALLLRMRSHPLPEARAYADLMLARAAQGHPELPEAGRPRRPRRGVEHLPRVAPAPQWTSSPSGSSRRAPVEPDGPAVTLSTATPTARSSSSPRSSTRTPTCPRRCSSSGSGP